MRKLAYVLVALLVVLAGCGAGGPTETSTATPDDSTAPPGESTATPSPTPTDSPPEQSTESGAPADPNSDTLGWEKGIWYNESLNVEAGDGLNATELNRTVWRTMARVEKVRQLEFEKDVPVDIITREEFANQTSNRSTSLENRLHQNVKWEAMFMVNESTDAVEVQQSNYASSVLGYYSPSEDRIVVISPGGENGSVSGLDEYTLSHELAHAVQDQHWNVSNFFGNTTETDNALSGVVEGDAHYTEYLYKQNCKSGEWDCLKQPSNSGGGGDLHVGLYVVSYVPYSEGQEFVKYIHDREGWSGVNALYDNPPASTEQLIHREKYPGDAPTPLQVADTSSNGWHVLDLPGPTDHASFGEAGLYSMMWYPSFAASQKAGALRNVVIDYRDFFQYKSGTNELQDIGPYDYGHEITDGWDGDRLVPYVKGDVTADAPTGYVWKIEWDTAADANEFVRAYEKLLQHHGAEQVGENTWRIPEGSEFADAYYVSVDGTTVTIVNAPSTDDLGDVHAGAGS